MSQTRERYFEITLLGLILIIGAILFYQATPFINGILGAITLYILLRRVNIYCSKRLSPRSAPWIIVGAVTVFLMVPFSCAAWYLVDLFQTFNFDIQPLIDRVQRTLSSIENQVGFDLVSEDTIKFMTARLTSIVHMFMSGINNFAITLFTSLLLLFFLLSGSVKMERYIARLLPFNENNKHTIIKNVTKIVRSNAIGIPLLAILQGIISSVCYTLAGVSNGIEFGILTGFASLIPIIGTMLVWIPLAVSQYFEAGLLPCIYVLGSGALVISQCDNVLRMFMQKRMSNTHPLVTISGVIVGLPLFGFMGLIFGPLLVAMFLLFLNMFSHQYLLGEDYFDEEDKLALAKAKASKVSSGGQGSCQNDMQSSVHQANLLSKSAQPHGYIVSKTKKAQGSQRQGMDAQESTANSRTSTCQSATVQMQEQARTKTSAKVNALESTKVSAEAQAPFIQKDQKNQETKDNTESSKTSPANVKAERSERNEPNKRNERKAQRHTTGRPSIDLVDAKKGKSKKDFKATKAEHKQQKREAAKRLAEQEQAKAQQAMQENSQEYSSSVDSVNKSTNPYSKQVSKVTTAQAQSNDDAFLSKQEAYQKVDSDLSTTVQDASLGSDFSLHKSNLDARQDNIPLAGRTIVSRAVAAALEPFADDQLTITQDHSEQDVGHNADMISSESMQTRSKQTSEHQGARGDGRRQAHNRARRPSSNADRPQRSRREGVHEIIERHSGVKSDVHGKESKVHATNPRQDRGVRARDRASQGKVSSQSRSSGQSKTGSRTGSQSTRGAVGSSMRNAGSGVRSNSRGTSSTRTDKHGARKSDSKVKSSASRSSKKPRRSTNQAGYEILRPERKKRYEDEPIIQTVVSHQYGNFVSKPRSTLRTQLVSVHTAKGTLMASTPRPHRTGKRRSSH